MNKIVKILAGGLLAMNATAGWAAVVPWTGPNLVSSQASVNVTPFVADRFLAALGNGTFGSGPGVPQHAELAVRLNGEWIKVSASPGGASGNLSTLLPGSSFGPGLIDGIRLSDVDNFGNTYGVSDGACGFFQACLQNLQSSSFQFNTVATTTVAWTGANNFLENTIFFDAFQADTLWGLGGNAAFGSGPGVPQHAKLELRINGSWQTVANTPFGASGNLNALFDKTSFSGGLVDGLRLSDVDNFGNAYNIPQGACGFFSACFSNLTGSSFLFSQTAVPEPASWMMMIVGFGLAGAAMRRRPVAMHHC